MTESSSYRESHLEKGYDYHESFSRYPHRAMLWQLERTVLDQVLDQCFTDGKPKHLDFACGTGRIISYLMDRTAHPTGVDVAPSMLAIARAGAPGATIVQADLTRENRLGDERFDLITAFRFFSNAEPSLRLEAMRSLARHLTDKGLLVFNNHKNAGSMVYRLVRLLGRGGYDGWSRQDVARLVNGAGLRIVREYPLGVLPLTDRHMVLPQWLARRAELIAGRFPYAVDLAQSIIYVCRQREGPEPRSRLR